MLEELKKYRELAAFVLLGAAALRLLAQLIGAFLYDDGRGLNFLYGARIIGISVLDPLLAIALVAFVAWCARDKTRNARLLALGALIVVGVGTLFGFLYLVLGLGGPGSNKFFGFLADLTQLVIPALLVFVLWRVFQSLPAPAFAANWTGYHTLFAVSAVGRVFAWVLLRRVTEAHAWRTRDLLRTARTAWRVSGRQWR